MNSKRARAAAADIWISGSRTTGDGVSDEENVTKAGLSGMPEYWQIQLSEPVPISSFIHLMASHFFEPSLTEGGNLYKIDLKSAINFLHDIGEATLIKLDGKEPMVRPRAVVECLLRMPKREHLVPDTLREFIKRETEIDVEIDGRAYNEISPQEPTQPEQADAPVVQLPSKTLEDFMRDEEKRLGRVPSQNDMEAAVRNKFGAMYKIRQTTCRETHKRIFKELRPGKRPRNCVE